MINDTTTYYSSNFKFIIFSDCKENNTINFWDMSYQKQCKWFLACPMKFYWERGKIDDSWISQYCLGNWSACIRFQKEESGIYHPDNMMPDGQINLKLK